MAILLKTTSVRVSSIQIMQVRVLRAPCLVGPLRLHRPQLQLHIFTFGEKKIREKDSSRFTIRRRCQALNSLGRADLESVRGSGEGESVAIVIINHPPSPIS